MDEFIQYILAQNRRGTTRIVEYNSPWRVPGSVKAPSAPEFPGKLDIQEKKSSAQPAKKIAKKVEAEKLDTPVEIVKPAPPKLICTLADWMGSTI
jgi:hypothetical protein